MSVRIKLALAAAAVTVVSLVGLGFAIYYSEDNINSQPAVASAQIKSSSLENVSALKVTAAVAPKASIDSSKSGSGHVKSFSNASETKFGSYDNASVVRSPHGVSSSAARTLEGDPEVEWPHIPLAFLNYAGVLPATPEVAAAIQHIQQEFIAATGAGTTNPADPGYGQTWVWAQPTADEEFYALFGIEAFNQMSIMEARELGHF